MKEIWKDIPEYEGYYKVSDLGRVKRLPGAYVPNGRILKPQKRNGYLSVSLSKNKKAKTHNIHRLVAKAFLGDSNLTVNHKDGNKHNNKLTNLEYCTARENCRHVFTSKIKITNCDKYKTEIIQDYKIGHTLTYLSKKYHVDFRDLKTFLLSNGFELKEQRKGNYPRVINQKILCEIKEIYENNPNISNKDISKMTKLSLTTIGRILKIIS